MDTDTTFMRAAIKQAQKAYEKSEVPIGCVIVHDGKIIARGYNRPTGALRTVLFMSRLSRVLCVRERSFRLV